MTSRPEVRYLQTVDESRAELPSDGKRHQQKRRNWKEYGCAFPPRGALSGMLHCSAGLVACGRSVQVRTPHDRGWQVPK